MRRITQSNITGIETYSGNRWHTPRKQPNQLGDLLLSLGMLVISIALATAYF